MLCWKTGTGMVTVAGVGAGVGVAVVMPLEFPPPPPGEGRVGAAAPELALTPLMMSAATPRLSTAPASATPPTVRNCRLVATADRMNTMVGGATFRKHDVRRHGIARCTGRG